MRIRYHKGFGHGLAPGYVGDLNCKSCRREHAAGVDPVITGEDDAVERRYTRDEVLAALNAAAEMVAREANPDGMEWSRSIRDQDIINLVVNAAGSFLDNPEATFDEVAGNYDAGADQIREWIS